MGKFNMFMRYFLILINSPVAVVAEVRIRFAVVLLGRLERVKDIPLRAAGMAV